MTFLLFLKSFPSFKSYYRSVKRVKIGGPLLISLKASLISQPSTRNNAFIPIKESRQELAKPQWSPRPRRDVLRTFLCPRGSLMDSDPSYKAINTPVPLWTGL